ncbi:OstA-like protein [Chitinophagaceae bacterium LWZ2-11]
MHKLLITVFLFTASASAWSQQAAKDTSSQGKIIEIISAERYNYQSIDTSQFVSLVGKANVKQGNTLFTADSIVLNQKQNMLEAFGNVHINDNDSINIYSEYLKYLGKEKKAYLNNKVKLTDGKGVLTTNNLIYDEQLKIGTYENGGKLVKGKTTLTSTQGFYYGETKDVHFINKVLLIDPETRIKTDTLYYNTNTEVATFVSPTKIYNEKRIINTREGFYDTKNRTAQFGSRPTLEDSTYTFTADRAAIDDKKGLSEYQGNVVYRSKDSIGYDLIANNVKVNKITNSLLATEKPLLFLKQAHDTTIISADTLYTAQLSQLLKSNRVVPLVRDTGFLTLELVEKTEKIDSNTNRFFEAYYNVKIYSDSMQAVGDSLFYSLQDSTFRLFKNPVVWSQNNQITGDTIYLYLQNRKPQRLHVFENALSVQKLGDKYFNQVRGTNMYGFFKEGKLDSLRTKGSPAESIYYGVDDHNKFIGVNKTSSDVIVALFVDGEINRVVFINNLQGLSSPMGQVDHTGIRLKRFKWLEELRPKTKFDLLR